MISAPVPRSSSPRAGEPSSPLRASRASLSESLELRPGDWVYATGYDLAHYTSRGILADWLLSIPDGVGLVIDLGPVQPDIPDQVLMPLLARATMLTGNDLEMGRLEDRLGGAQAIREACPRALIVRRTGAHGCVLHPVDGEPIEVAGFVRDVVDTTGAGDTHTGVLVAGLLDGLDVVEAARRANAAAGPVQATAWAAAALARLAQAPLCEEIDEFLRADDERS